MALSIKHAGVRLTQKQLDAIVPVLNKNMERSMGQYKFEKACETACRDAGVPIILTLEEAKATLASAVTVSSDGFQARQLDAERYEAVMAYLDSLTQTD